MTYHSFRIWYGDGRVVAGVTEADWIAAPADNVQAVSVYFRETYRIWREDHWDVEHYRQQFHSVDYYWFSGPDSWGAGQVKDVPTALPDGALKLGGLIPDSEWWPLYNAAKDLRVP
jgi:hypothetical protein